MEPQISFNQVVSKGCGFDVHQKVVMATISGEGLKKATREFGTFIHSLTELKYWLLENGTTQVAMESTGVYWKPVYHVLKQTSLKVCKHPRVCAKTNSNLLHLQLKSSKITGIIER